MLRATKLLVVYLVGAVALVLPKACAATDNQSDDGSRIVGIGGNSETAFPPDSPNFGTYKTVAKGKNKGAIRAKCRWRLLVPIPNRPGKYFQTSPTKAGSWHHLNFLGHGTVKIKPVSDPKYKGQPRVLDSENCPKWEMRK